MLGDIFNPKCIKLNLESTTKDEAFEELIETIAENHADFDRREMLEAVTLRESKMNTIIRPGIALPHGYSRSVSGIVGALGFSRTGIEYDEKDRNPVHLFLMLLMDESSRERNLQVLSNLWELVDASVFSKIREMRSPQEVYSLLSLY